MRTRAQSSAADEQPGTPHPFRSPSATKESEVAAEYKEWPFHGFLKSIRIKLMVDRGSSLSATSNAGRTAHELAEESGIDRSIMALDGEALSTSRIKCHVFFH